MSPMIKVIKIQNKAALDKFYRRLFFYKRFWFKKTKFVLDSHYNELNPIIEALNIKNKKQRITYIYDKACEQIDDYYQNKNICGLKNNKCYVQQKLNNKAINGCCRICLYQSSKGCTTKNLTCKLFTCSEVEKRCKVITFDDLKILNLLSFRNRMILKSDYFSKREDVINDLYIGSMFIWCIKLVVRMINTIYVLKRKKIEEK